MRKLLKMTSVLTAFIMCFSICGCDSKEKDSSKEESVVETTEQETTELLTEATTENQNELDLTIDYDENVSYKVNSNWLRDDVEFTNRFYLNNFDVFILSDISGDTDYEYVTSDLITFAEQKLSDGTINDYSFTKIDNQNAIVTNDDEIVGYLFIANGKMYSLMITNTVDFELIDNIVKSIKIKDAKKTVTETTVKAETNDSQSIAIYEDETVKITYTGIEESWLGTGIKLNIENLSDKKICVQARDTSINGIMTKPIFSSTIVAGKKINDEMSFTNLEEDGIDKVETIELSFHIFDYDNRDTIVDTDPITIDISK